ncbi:MAG: hypothetical protein ACK40O_01795, partial [Allosphingosinicella sp.]
MPQRTTRRRAAENAAFLAALAKTGNARLAARLLGVHRAAYTKRRAKDPDFAARWDAALAFAHAAFHEADGRPPPPALPAAPGDGALRTKGGEPRIVRTRAGRLQLRRALPGRMTKAAEQAFLAALAASANIRLAAAAAGFAHSSFYARARASPAFAREARLALAAGYERVEAAAIAAALPSSHEDDRWRHNDPPPLPRMTPGQALQLLYLHEKSVRQGWTRPHRRRRRGESDETHRLRLAAMWSAEQASEAEDAALARAARAAVPDDYALGDAPLLPDLDQITDWSKA